MEFVGQERMNARMEFWRNAEYLEFAFPFVVRFAIIRMGARGEWSHYKFEGRLNTQNASHATRN
jgi:hypothetical protein